MIKHNPKGKSFSKGSGDLEIKPLPLHALFHIDVPIRYVRSQDHFTKSLSQYQLSIPSRFLLFPIYAGWNEDGLFFAIEWPLSPPYKVVWPKYRSGASFELYIDTKNRETFRLVHPCCHHFLIFPEALEGVQSREITEFRTQESRSLVPVNCIQTSFYNRKKEDVNYFILSVPDRSLFKWSGEEGNRISFCAVLNYVEGKKSESIPLFDTFSNGASFLEKSPQAWISATLVKS